MAKSHVYVVGPDYGISVMFAKRGYRVVRDIAEADIVVWSGGADVNPALYGEKPLEQTSFNPRRDQDDIQAWKISTTMGAQLRVGICRGGQFLNVQNGGRLWQHVNKHTSDHLVLDIPSQTEYLCSSTHHQMMRPGNGAQVLGIGIHKIADMQLNVCNFKFADGQSWNEDDAEDPDVEVVWYEHTRSLCFQPHPEMRGYDQCTKYFFNLIERYVA